MPEMNNGRYTFIFSLFSIPHMPLAFSETSAVVTTSMYSTVTILSFLWLLLPWSILLLIFWL